MPPQERDAHLCIPRGTSSARRHTKRQHRGWTGGRRHRRFTRFAKSSERASSNRPYWSDSRLSTRYLSSLKKAQCPHGLTGKKLIDGASCTQAHPKRCIRYCRFGLSKRGGCTRGAECRYYHPVLCRNALVNKRCTRENCTFTHLKGTRRHQEDEKRRTQAGRDAGQEAPAAGRDSNTRVSTAQQGQPSQDPNTGQRVRFNISGDAQHHQRQSTGAAPAQPATNLSCDASFLEDLISRIMDRKFNQMQRPTMMQPAMQTRLNPQAQAFTSAFPPLSMS